MSPAGLEALRGRAGQGRAGQGRAGQGRAGQGRAGGSNASRGQLEPVDDEGEAFDPPIATRDDEFVELFAAVDAAIAHPDNTLAGERRPRRCLPPILAAAIAHEAWIAIEPLQRVPGLGRLLAAAVLQDRRKARAHLPCLALPRARRSCRANGGEAATSRVAELDATAAGAEVGLKQHDRWLFARTQLLRKLDGRRSASKLPGLVDYVMSLPIVSAGMIAKALDITPRAAQNLVAELDLREAMAADDPGVGRLVSA
jgi:Protein of unknown function (DUF1612)/HTH DNA binding domain